MKMERLSKYFLKCSEWSAVRFANKVISNNKAIREICKNEYGLEKFFVCVCLSDHVICEQSQQFLEG